MLDHRPASDPDMPLTMCLKDFKYSDYSAYAHDNMLDFCLGRSAVVKEGWNITHVIIPDTESQAIVDDIAQLALMSGLEHVETKDVDEDDQTIEDVACRTTEYRSLLVHKPTWPMVAFIVTLRRREATLVHAIYRNIFRYIHVTWNHKYQKLIEYVGLVFEQLQMEELKDQIVELENTRL
jgi:hypothetical protein